MDYVNNKLLENNILLFQKYLKTKKKFDYLKTDCEIHKLNVGENKTVLQFDVKLYEENNAVVEYLRETARQITKPTKDELKHLIIEYRSKLNLVKKKFI